MSATETLDTGIPPELMAELQEAANRAAKGIRAPEIVPKAREDMDRLRDQIRRREGLLDIAVPAIRELLDEAPVPTLTSSAKT